jgi:hypothetical protein
MSTIKRFDGLEVGKGYFDNENLLAKALNTMPPEALPLWRIVAPILVFLVLFGLGRTPQRPLLAILLRCCLAVIAYAMLQDQFSVRLSKEYFTLGHAPIEGLDNPTLLGLAWGFLGGFPGGIVLGIPIALAATLGPWPRLEGDELALPLGCLVAGVGLASLIAGLSAWYNAGVVNIAVGEPWASWIALERQRNFFIVACAHFGTYLGGISGGLLLTAWVVLRRRSKHLQISTK